MVEAEVHCLDEETVILLAQGALAGHALRRAEEHLAQCADCRALLGESLHDAEQALADPQRTHALGSSPAITPEGELEVPAIGSVLVGKYRVESMLGSGGMGVVLAATHLVLGNRVAIKVLRRPGASEVARFLREARVSAQIRNRHIARVFDFGQLPSGAPFLVMEYLEGRDLAQCIEGGPLPAQVAVDYVLQACEALAEVHGLGIVHRDLKPANLFLTLDQGRPVVKVLDFGIFKSVAGAALNVGMASTQLTGAHVVIGSPVYMSPEQMRGDEVDARSDVWALGVILYELMTSELPFGERTLSALAMAVATEEPVPPSRLVPEIPRNLEQVVLRCLRKRPEERFADAAALRDALSQLHAPAPRSLGAWIALGVAAVAGALWWGTRAPDVQPRPAEVVRSAVLQERGPRPAETQPARVETVVAEDAAAEPSAVPEPKLQRATSAPPTKIRRPKRSAREAPRALGPTDTPD